MDAEVIVPFPKPAILPPNPSAVYAGLFGRACLLVCLTAFNVSHIAHGDFRWAFVTGGAISWLWWANSRSAAWENLRFSRLAYTAGAACGTVVGMWLARVL